MYTPFTFLPTCLHSKQSHLGCKAATFFSEIFHLPYIYMAHRYRQVAISSVPNLDYLSSDNASFTHIIVKLKFVIRLKQDSFSTVFSTKSRCFSSFFLKNPACHVIFVNFSVVFSTSMTKHLKQPKLFNYFCQTSSLLIIDRFPNTSLDLLSD